MKILVSYIFNLLCVCSLIAQPTINWTNPTEVSTEEFGNKSARIGLNNLGNPIVLHGKSGNNAGLYLSIMTEGEFGTPILVTPETNIFLSESEGPRMAVSGDRIAVSYQISGEWASGAYVVLSDDGGLTWGTPYPLAPNATQDHFDPVVAFDGNNNPWVGLKWGTNPALEGIHLFNNETDSFDPAINGGVATAGAAVCECCPSNTFFQDGVYYNVVRNNFNNTRDFWLTASQDGSTWTDAIDIDPTDWNISRCPASGASSTIMDDGTLVSCFMSAVDGDRVYWSTVDIATLTFQESGRIDPLNNSTENHPSISSSGDWLVTSWERYFGGYEIMVAVSDAGADELENSVVNITADLSGHKRNPAVIYDGEFIHLVYKNTTEGIVNYMKGEISGTSKVEGVELDDSPWAISIDELGWTLRGGNASYILYDLNGRALESGAFFNELYIPDNNKAMILQLRTDNQVQSFKLIR
jgi:hypothetical protein